MQFLNAETTCFWKTKTLVFLKQMVSAISNKPLFWVWPTGYKWSLKVAVLSPNGIFLLDAIFYRAIFHNFVIYLCTQ